MVEWALESASRGWRVFPLGWAGDMAKKPLIPGWPAAATTNPDQILEWWRRWPRANVGVATGAGSGIIAVDLDGPLGQATLDNLLDPLGGMDLPPTYEVHTGREGGRHLYFATADPALRNSEGKIGPGLDVRANGGYAVGAGSVHPSGRRYTEAPGCPTDPAPLPDWLRDAMLAAQGSGKTRGGTTAAGQGTRDVVAAVKAAAANLPPRQNGRPGRPAAQAADQGHTGSGYGRSALAAEARAVSEAGEGTRNSTLNRASFRVGQLVGGGCLDRDNAAQVLLDAAMAAGLGEAEARATIRSGLDAGQREPRTAPPPARRGRGRPRKIELDDVTTDAADDHADDGDHGCGLANPLASLGSGGVAARCTDMANARRFVEQHGGIVRYCPALKSWFVWDGRRWCRDEIGRAEGAAKATVRSLWSEVAAARRDSDQEELMLHARRSADAPRIAALLRLAQSEPGIAISADALDADPLILNCQNGLLDLRDCTLRPHDPAAMCSRIVAAPYDQTATAPTWAKALATWHNNNTNVIEYLRRLAGYSLSGLTGEKILAFSFGELGNNGKSTFWDTLASILNGYAERKLDLYNLLGERGGGGNTPERARLLGIRLALCSEVEADQPLRESTIRDLSGGVDCVTATPKYGHPFTFKPTAKIAMFGNFRPQLRGTDPALWQRVHTIPWLVSIPPAERDPQFADRLRVERPGILAWMVAGWRDYQQQGLNPPAEVVRATDDYRLSQDSVTRWINDCCVLAPEFRVPASRARAGYVEWCRTESVEPLSGERFALALERCGEVRRKHTREGRVYVGLGLQAVPSETRRHHD